MPLAFRFRRPLHRLVLVAGAVSLVVSMAAGCAQKPSEAAYPSKAVEVTVAFAPGGSADQQSRLLADYLSKKWGQPVSVVNKAGGGGATGTAATAQAAPDGYSVNNGMVNTLAYIPASQKNSPYNWDSFTYLARLCITPSVLVVNANSPYKTAKDLVDAIKKDPSKFNAGVSGLSGTGVFGIAQLLKSQGIDPAAVKMVNFDGGSQVITNLAGGHVDFAAQQLPEVLEMVKGGKLRALAHTYSERLKDLPDVPTAKEAGYPEYTVMPTGGFVGPKGIPEAVVTKWETAIGDALKDKDFAAALQKTGAIGSYQSSKDYRAGIETEFKTASDLAKTLGLVK
ncbi:MAG TPA: tripartite tricarboxylate transporter substrate binding protein [Chloroflexota bacterium]|nr:tripartite tricarboxylate transporter substrate binding protein [Chloroflexota bacterium]